MKKNDKDQIVSATVVELAKKATELKKQISDEILKRQSSNVKNVHTVKAMRYKLAVVLSAKRAKELTKER
jgi:ribosomal protein L29